MWIFVILFWTVGFFFPVLAIWIPLAAMSFVSMGFVMRYDYKHKIKKD